jgi:hypothetical protein
MGRVVNMAKKKKKTKKTKKETPVKKPKVIVTGVDAPKND